MNIEEIAKKMLEQGKGILAADESTGTMEKRLKSVNVDCTEKNRLHFRETLFSSSAMKSNISGVILFDETIRQKTSEGITVPELIKKNGALPGIKVDKGAKPLAGSDKEKVTEGLDGLGPRMKEYYKLGARFAKWRAVYSVSSNLPSEQCIKSNAHALARYSAIVQEAGMVPIVEPEVLMDGVHDIDKCFEVSSKVLDECVKELILHKVNLKGIVLKPNMILPGSKNDQKKSSEEIAKKTLEFLKNSLPKEVPGVAFLSGGQSEVEATKNLNSINKINDSPFKFTFSYGRALQQSALKTWASSMNDKAKIQKVFDHRARMNGLSTEAKWTESLEKQIA